MKRMMVGVATLCLAVPANGAVPDFYTKLVIDALATGHFNGGVTSCNNHGAPGGTSSCRVKVTCVSPELDQSDLDKQFGLAHSHTGNVSISVWNSQKNIWETTKWRVGWAYSKKEGWEAAADAYYDVYMNMSSYSEKEKSYCR